MHRTPHCLRALFTASLLWCGSLGALAAPFVGGKPSADPELAPLGGPVAHLKQPGLKSARPAASRPPTQRPSAQIPLSQRPLAQIPTFKANAATKPPGAPADEPAPFYPGVTYSDASEKSATPGQPSPALGPAPYDLGLIKKLQIGAQTLPNTPLRVGNLDILAPFVDQIGALGASVSKVDPRNVPGSLNVPNENQYFQINRPNNPPIVFTVGKSMAYVDGNQQPLRAAPLVIGNQIFLPIFSVAPLIGAAARLDTDGTLFLTPTIQSVELFPIKDTVAVTIQASAPVSSRDIKIVQVKAAPGSSAKVFLDFPGFSMGFDAGNSTIERMVALGAGDVLRARAGMPSKFPDVTRIVLDLKRPLQGVTQTVPDPTLFALVLAPQGSNTPPPPDRVFVDPKPTDRFNPKPPATGDGFGVVPPPTGTSGAPVSNRVNGPSLRGLTIVVDAGHGGGDTGARGRFSLEKDHTLDISRRLKSNLQARGATVLMTRDRDVKPELQDRVSFANARRADLFVSVHINASPNPASSGTQTFYYTANSQSLAREVQKELQKATGRPNRGITQRRFVVVRYTNMPSILTETAFISNPKEEALLRDPNFRERVARGIAQGLANYVAIYGRPGLRG